MNSTGSNRLYAALGLAGQAGCMSVIMAVGALLVGLWLDQRLGTHRTWALICVIGSVPVNLILTLFVTQRMIARIVPQDQPLVKRSVTPSEGKNADSDEEPQ
jgi:hypothetical protein